ncbi:DNA-directed RNA polymerase subunit beta [Ornithinibacillus contaminans]|uniref:DNA-directed RNA polymerase subunit beta n=1 Tax=Ornithinibacillus contaminans TaxID=694055 RepID=UPI0009FA9FF8|nr:DNA-directed RNA polymerase subunit beta [Ornithinibacillus contaminans]
MSTTNQFDKTKEENASEKKQIELTSVRNVIEQESVSKKVPVISRRTKEAEPDLSEDEAKERRRKRSASAEIEMTETQAQTRKQQKKQQKLEKRQNKMPRLRIFPIWLRIVVVVVLAVVALLVGLMIGYGGLGDGNPRDALKWETWQHIIDIVVKEE